VVDALLVAQPRHSVCNSYLASLALSGTEVYFNRLLELELAEVAYKVAVKERFGNSRARRMRTDGRALRRASRLAERLSSSWDGILANFTWARVEVQEVADEVPALMRRGLGSYDAVHAATALKLGVGHLVTTDSGFGLVREPDLTIVTDQSLLAACRRHRKRGL
jgi:predicted nucleic acid-binding protein